MEKLNRPYLAEGRINFGRHQGEPMDQIPRDYLQWVIREFRQTPRASGLVAAAAQELQRREHAGVLTLEMEYD